MTIYLRLIIQKQPPRSVIKKKAALKDFTKIHRKTPLLESLFNKVAGLKTATLLKRDSSTGVFL